MKSIRLVLTLLATLPALAHAAISVFACEPEWGALAREIGGDAVKVYTATTAMQDPHRIEARPSLIAQMRRANLVVCTGAELEVGWLPLLQRESGNADVQPGRPGYFEATRYVTLLDKPALIDRSQGDVHAAGNPHIQTDPRNIARVGEALAKRLSEIDPDHAAAYQAHWKAFSVRWDAAVTRWQAQATPLKGMPVVVQHKSFTYLINWLGLREVATLEPKPGIEPSVGYLAEVAAHLKTTPAKAVLRATYQNPRASEWLAERVDIPAVALPFTVGGAPGTDDLFGLFDVTLADLLKIAR
jgi:zinc/manganese transport system substrate-binding protein